MIELAERCPGLKSVCVSNCSHLTDQVDIAVIAVIIVIIVIIFVIVIVVVIVVVIIIGNYCTLRL